MGILEESYEEGSNLERTVAIGDAGTFAIEGIPAMGAGGLPDISIDWGKYGGVSIRAASIRGRLHRYEGTPRQDAYSMAFAESDSFFHSVVAIADGVGSLPMSHVAAEVSVCAAAGETKRQILSSGLDFVDWKQVFESAVNSLYNKTGIPSEKVTNMACTLLVAVLRTSPASPSTYADCRIAGIGDSSAWKLDRQQWKNITPPKCADGFVSDASVDAIPLCSMDKLAITETSLQKGESLFLFTDGVSDPMGDGDSLLGQCLADAFSAAPSPYRFAHVLDFARRSHSDDRTAVGLWIC